MSGFSVESIPIEFHRTYYAFMAKIDKNGIINVGRKSPNGLVDYSHLSQCWTHHSSKSSNGYGQMMSLGRTWNLHKWSYWLYHGQPDLDDRFKHISHQCDNPDCANPDHLIYKSVSENVIEGVDRVRTLKQPKPVIRNSEPCFGCVEHHKSCDGGIPCERCVSLKMECVKKDHKTHSGTFTSETATGENNANAKATAGQVKEIRAKVMAGLPYGGLAKLLKQYPNISYQVALKFVGNRSWSCAESKPPGWDAYKAL